MNTNEQNVIERAEVLIADSVPGEPAEAKRGRGRPAKQRPGRASTDAKAAQQKSILPPPSGAKVGRPAKNDAELRKAALSFLGWVGAGMAMVSPVDAAVLEVRTERIAGRMAEVAATNDALARFLLAAGTGGGWAGLAMELGTVGLAIGANHGAVPPAVAQMVMPEYLTVLRDEQQRQAQEQAEVQRRRAARGQSL